MGNRTPSIVRMHTKRDGTAKKKLNQAQAARARADGLYTYLCPICGGTHAGNPR